MPDILIRGMEMPKGCKSCKLSSDSHCNATGKWLFSTDLIRSGFNWKTCRLPDCPLHELPAHGDLISRDEAVSVLQSIGSRDYRREKGTICDAIKMISHSQYVPTIVPASEEATNDPKP